MNKLDQNLQFLCPTVMVPRFEQLQPLDANGHRFLAAGDGLWIEVKRSWLNARMPIASSPLRLPYGMVEPVVDFRFGRGLLPLLERFTLEARAFPFLVRRVRMRTFRQSRPDRRGSSRVKDSSELDSPHR